MKSFVRLLNRIEALLFTKLRNREDFQKRVDLWIKAYPRLGREPAMRELLDEAIAMKLRIEELEDRLNRMKDKEYISTIKLIDKLLNRWTSMLTKMGLATTAQPYIHKDKKRGRLSPEEALRLKMAQEEQENDG